MMDQLHQFKHNSFLTTTSSVMNSTGGLYAPTGRPLLTKQQARANLMTSAIQTTMEGTEKELSPD